MGFFLTETERQEANEKAYGEGVKSADEPGTFGSALGDFASDLTKSLWTEEEQSRITGRDDAQRGKV